MKKVAAFLTIMNPIIHLSGSSVDLWREPYAEELEKIGFEETSLAVMDDYVAYLENYQSEW